MIRSAALLALTSFALTLAAEDFGPVAQAAQRVFKGRTHFGVVCDARFSRQEVADLQRALADESVLTVVDYRAPTSIGAAAVVIAQRGVEVLVLLPHDPLIRDGSAEASELVRQLGSRIPAIGTTSAALKSGCAFAVGSTTRGELMLNPGVLERTARPTDGPARTR